MEGWKDGGVLVSVSVSTKKSGVVSFSKIPYEAYADGVKVG